MIKYLNDHWFEKVLQPERLRNKNRRNEFDMTITIQETNIALIQPP